MQNSIELSSNDKGKINFLRMNFGLKPLENGIKLCEIRLERINLEDHIPLSKLRKYLIFKKSFGMKRYIIKLNRVQLLWNKQRFKANSTIKI